MLTSILYLENTVHNQEVPRLTGLLASIFVLPSKRKTYILNTKLRRNILPVKQQSRIPNSVENNAVEADITIQESHVDKKSSVTTDDTPNDSTKDNMNTAVNSADNHAKKQGEWSGFSIRDIVFLSVCGVLIIVFSAFTGPLHALGIFGLPQMTIAIFFAFFMSLGILRVRKPGSATIIAIVSSLIMVLMRPVSGFMVIIAAIVAELIVLVIFRNYTRLISIRVVSSLIPVFMVPVQIAYYTLILHMNINALVRLSPLVVLIFVGTIILAILGSFFGLKVGRELIASGRIK